MKPLKDLPLREAIDWILRQHPDLACARDELVVLVAQREEAERERITKAVHDWFCGRFGYPDQAISLLEKLYLPKAKMLPPGKYWARQSDWTPGKAVILEYDRYFAAETGTEYIPCKNPFEDQP